jgi:hypothetical protein
VVRMGFPVPGSPPAVPSHSEPTPSRSEPTADSGWTADAE